MFDLIAILLVATAALAVLGRRVLQLPGTLGPTLGALIASLLLMVAARADWAPAAEAVSTLRQLPFDELVLEGLLSLLLFAGALSVRTRDLWAVRGGITAFALLATTLSVLLVGGAMYLVSSWIGLPLGLLPCLVFGALISPTDPVAVLDVLRRSGAPREVEAVVAGESLFNDAVGVVAFSVLASAAFGLHGHAPGIDLRGALGIFTQEVGLGLLLGLCGGGLALVALRRIDEDATEILITLATCVGVYALARHLHGSGPLAVVVAGLLINHYASSALHPENHDHFEAFWRTADELLNTGLFVLLSLELVAVIWTPDRLWLSLAAVPAVLLARAGSVWFASLFVRFRRPLAPWTRRILIWGGLRGGIAVALAFTLPSGAERETLLALTYGVVVFSLVVQATTVGSLAARARTESDRTESDRTESDRTESDRTESDRTESDQAELTA